MIKKQISRGFDNEGFYVEVHELYVFGIKIYSREFFDGLTDKATVEKQLACEHESIGFAEPENE